MRNKRGNIMINLLFFMMALGVVMVMVGPMNDFLDLAQQSDMLNCKGFIYNGNVNHTLSYNSTLHGGSSGSPLSCLALKLYLPYILLTFLIAGLGFILANKAGEVFAFPESNFN